MSPVFSLTDDMKIALGVVALVGFLHAVSTAIWVLRSVGPVAGLGNRDDVPGESGWALRLRKAWFNYLENAVIFFALVLAAMVSETQSAQAGIGALIFASARAVYLPVYAIGMPLLRSIVWLVGFAGLGVMAAAIFL